MKLRILGSLFVFSIYSACSTQTESSIEVSYANFEAAYRANPKIHVLDVRTPQEYQEGHVPGAVLLPLQDIEAKGRSVSLPFAKEDQIYVICRSGRRSVTAAKILQEAGYNKSISVQGGTLAWIKNGNSVER